MLSAVLCLAPAAQAALASIGSKNTDKAKQGALNAKPKLQRADQMGKQGTEGLTDVCGKNEKWRRART